MAQNDFNVTFGSNLPQFVGDSKAQIEQLDAAIRSLGGAMQSLSGVNPAEIKKLDAIAKALSGGGAIHIDTRQLDSSIKDLKTALAQQLGKFTAALNKAPQAPTGEAKGLPATLKVDLTKANEAIEAANTASGKLKRQASWLQGHVEKLLEHTRGGRDAFKEAKKSAEGVRKSAVGLKKAAESFNEKMEYAASILNGIKIDTPDDPNGGGGGGGTPTTGRGGALLVQLASGPPIPVTLVDSAIEGGGFPGSERLAKALAGQESGASKPPANTAALTKAQEKAAKAEEERTSEVNELISANKREADSIRANATVLEQLLEARRTEVVYQRRKKNAHKNLEKDERGKIIGEIPDPLDLGLPEKQLENYMVAMDGLEAAIKKRKELEEKITAAEKVIYDAANEPEDGSDKVPALAAAREKEKAKRLELADALEAGSSAAKADAEETKASTGRRKAASSKRTAVDKQASSEVKREAEAIRKNVSALEAAAKARQQQIKDQKTIERVRAQTLKAGKDPDTDPVFKGKKGGEKERERYEAALGRASELQETLNEATARLTDEERARYEELQSAEGVAAANQVAAQEYEARKRAAELAGEEFKEKQKTLEAENLLNLEAVKLRKAREAAAKAHLKEATSTEAASTKPAAKATKAATKATATPDAGDMHDEVIAAMIEAEARSQAVAAVIEGLTAQLAALEESGSAAAEEIAEVRRALAEAKAIQAGDQGEAERATKATMTFAEAVAEAARVTREMGANGELVTHGKAWVDWFGDSPPSERPWEVLAEGIDKIPFEQLQAKAAKARADTRVEPIDQPALNLLADGASDLQARLKAAVEANDEALARSLLKQYEDARTVLENLGRRPPPQNQGSIKGELDEIQRFIYEWTTGSTMQRLKDAFRGDSGDDGVANRAAEEVRKAMAEGGELEHSLYRYIRSGFQGATQAVQKASDRVDWSKVKPGEEVDLPLESWTDNPHVGALRDFAKNSDKMLEMRGAAAAELAKLMELPSASSPQREWLASGKARVVEVTEDKVVLEWIGEPSKAPDQEFANALKASGEEPGRQLAEGVLDAFVEYINTRRATPAEAEAFELREKAARSGGRNLGTDLNLIGGMSGNTSPGVVDKSVMASAKSLAEILGDQLGTVGDKFADELTRVLMDFTKTRTPETADETGEMLRNLVLPFPEGLPEELARALAGAIRDAADSGESHEEVIRATVRELADVLRRETTTAPDVDKVLRERMGEGRTGSAIATESGRAKVRDYGTFGGDPESRAAIDAAIDRISEFGNRNDEASAAVSRYMLELDSAINPIKDLKAPEIPPELTERAQELSEQLRGMDKGDPGYDNLKKELNETYVALGKAKEAFYEFTRARTKLQEWMVTLDNARRDATPEELEHAGLTRMTAQEEAYAAARAAALDEEVRAKEAAKDAHRAYGDARTSMEESMQRFSADPRFKDMGRVLKPMSIEDFPGMPDTGAMKAAIEAFNKDFYRFASDVAKEGTSLPEAREYLNALKAKVDELRANLESMDVEDPNYGAAKRELTAAQTELTRFRDMSADTSVDDRLRELFAKRDALFGQQMRSIEAEIEDKQGQLAAAKENGAGSRVIAALEGDLVELKEKEAAAKREQARILRETEYFKSVPRDPAGVVKVEEQRLKQQRDRVDAGTPTESSVYAKPAEMAAVLDAAIAAFEKYEALSKRYEELENYKIFELEEIAKRRKAAEEKLKEAVEKMGDREAVRKIPTKDEQGKTVYRRITPDPEADAVEAARAELAAAGSAEEYEQTLRDLRAEMDLAQAKLEEFKNVFPQLFPAPDPRTGEGGREGVKVTRGDDPSVTSRVPQLQKELAAVTEELENLRKKTRKTAEDHEKLNALAARQRGIQEDLRDPSKRTAEGPGRDRAEIRSELEYIRAQIRAFLVGLGDDTDAEANELRAKLERRQAITDDLARTDEKRQLKDETGNLIDRDRLESELKDLERALADVLKSTVEKASEVTTGSGEVVTKPGRTLPDLEARLKELDARLREPETKVDRSGATVRAEDLNSAAAILGRMVNETIANQVAAQYDQLDRRMLSSATDVEPAATATDTLDAFKNRLTEAVIAAHHEAVGRMAGASSATQAAGVAPPPGAGAGAGAPPPPSGPFQPVRDEDGNRILREISTGIQRLIECCQQMAAGAAPKTATAAVPSGRAMGWDAAATEMDKALNPVKEAAKSTAKSAKNSADTAEELRNKSQIIMDNLAQQTGKTFTAPEQLIKQLLKGTETEAGYSASKAARTAGQAFGISDPQEMAQLQAAAETLERQLKKQASATREAEHAATRAAKAEAARVARTKEFEGNPTWDTVNQALKPLIEQLVALERAAEGAADATEKARLEQEAAEKRAEIHHRALGTRSQPGLIPRGSDEGQKLLSRALGGGNEMKQAGADAARLYHQGFKGVIQKPGAFSFIDRTLQTSMVFFIRSIASTMTFGLQRQLRGLISVGIETESTFVRVSSAMEATGRSADGLRGKISDISTDLGVSLKDLYEITARLAGVFDDPQDVIGATRSIATLEILSQHQLNAIEGYRAMSAIQNVFWDDLEQMGLEGEDVFNYINDTVVAMQDLTGINIEDLLEGAASLGGVTQPLNFGLIETQALVGKVAQTIGQTGTQAAEQLGRIFSNISNEKFQEALLSYDVATMDQILQRDFKTIFENIAKADLSDAQTRNLADLVGGDRQFRAAMALFSQSADIVDTYTAAQDSAGRAEERRKELMAELAEQIGILGKTFENLVASFVRSGFLDLLSVTVKTLNLVLDPLNKVINLFNDMADKNRFVSFLRSIAGIAAGLGAVLLVAKALRNEVATFMQLGSVKVAQAAAGAGPAVGAAGAAAAPAVAGGRLGFMNRRHGVEKVEIANLRELRDVLRVRKAAEAAGEAPLDYVRSRQDADGRFRPTRYGIGGQAAPDAFPTMPRAVLDKATGSATKLGAKLTRVGDSMGGAEVAATKGAAATRTMTRDVTIFGKRSAILSQGARLGGLGVTKLGGRFIWLGKVMDKLAVGAVTLGARFQTAIARTAGIAMGAASIAMLVHAITDMGHKIRKEADELADLRWGEPNKGTSEEDDPKDVERSKIRDLREKSAVDFGMGGRGKLFDESSWRNVGNFLTYTAKNPAHLLPGGQKFAEAAAGQLEEEVQDRLDRFREDAFALSKITDPSEQKAKAEELLSQFQKEADSLYEGAGDLEAQKAEALNQMDGLEGLMSGNIAAAAAILEGIESANRLAVGQVSKLLGGVSMIQGLPPGFAAEFSDSLMLLFEAQGMPESAMDELQQLASSGTYQGRTEVTRKLMKNAEDNARANIRALVDAKAPADEIQRAEADLQAAITNFAAFENDILQAALGRAQSLAQLAQFRGGTGVSQLRQAVTAARAIAERTDAGSPERAAAELVVIEAERAAAEAVNERANLADALTAATTRDTMVSLTANLDTAKRRLETAQANKGLYTPEQLQALVIEVSNLEKQVADEEWALAQAYNSLAQARTRNPLTKAVLAQKIALEALVRGRSLGLSQTEIAALEAAEAQAADAVQDQTWADQDALQSLRDSRITNVMGGHAAAVREAARQLSRARNNNMGSAAIYAAEQAYEAALRAETDERRSIAEAAEDAGIGRIKNDMQRVRAQAQANARRMKQAATIYGKDSTQYIQAMQAYHQSLDEIATTQDAIDAALRQLSIGRAQNAHLDVQAARETYNDARIAYQKALKEYGSNDARTIQAQQAMEAAQAGLRDSILDDAQRRIDWQLSMEQITQRQALAAYQNILNTFEMTQRQREDIMLKMKQMKDSINSAMEGQWNLGDIKIPTPYEVRRSMGLDGIQSTVNDVVSNFTEMFGATAKTLAGRADDLMSGAGSAQQYVTTNNETTILVNGADVAQVKQILTQILGPNAMARTTSGASGTRRL